MQDYSLLIKTANELGCTVKKNELMSKHTTFKIGGPAELFIEVYNKEQLKEILKITDNIGVDIFTIGNGSNLLVSDKGLEAVVIKLSGDFCGIKLFEDNKIKCGAGATLAKLCMFALNNSLTGLEFAWGIPGTAGGAAFMNAGAYCGEMKDVVVSCEHIDKKGNIGTFSKDELEFSYRHSIYSSNDYIITEITLKLEKGDHDLIRYKMDDFMNRRKSKQPLEYPSAGSVFKRPEGYFAGTLIQDCGLKGKTVGGAMVSKKHAGFIINVGNAKCKDVLDLIELIKLEVKEQTGVMLECEVNAIGNKL